MNRRGFLKGILLTASAPAIVRVASLMPIATPHVWRSPYLTDPTAWYIRVDSKIIWPGVKLWWDKEYGVLHSDEVDLLEHLK